MSVRLHINVDHVATLRNARGTSYPDPVRAAAVCLEAGADGITAHLREDRRHIVDADVEKLRAMLGATFNLELAATDEMVRIATRVRPDVVTLVPERRRRQPHRDRPRWCALRAALAHRVSSLLDAKIKVSLFIAADDAQIRASKALGVQQIELHTGEYAHAVTAATSSAELARLASGAHTAASLGLEVAAGHGLTLANVPALMKVREIVELNIGHAVVADAVFMSLAGAVRAMRQAIDAGSSAP
jgi:pyridoxine 5-phosphate synthase